MDWFKDVEDSGVQIQPEECLLAGSGTHVAAGGAKDALRKAELAVTVTLSRIAGGARSGN